MNKKVIIILIAVLCIWNLFLTIAFLESDKEEERHVINNTSVSGFSTDLTKVAENIRPSMVTVRSGNSLSSGFVYANKEGVTYICTTAHGLEDEAIQVVFANDLSYPAELVGKDVYSDLALLKVKLDFKVEPLVMGDSDLLEAGEFLLVLGTPISLEYRETVSLAMVSSKERMLEDVVSLSEEEEKSFYTTFLQMTSTLNPGNSGGAVVNMNGEVVGMNLMKSERENGEGIVFALPSSLLRRILDTMMEGKPYQRQFLGIKGISVGDMENYEKSVRGIALDQVDGYYVSSVRNDAIATSAGLVRGDIILSINDEKIQSGSDLIASEYSNAKRYVFEVLRGEKIVELRSGVYD